MRKNCTKRLLLGQVFCVILTILAFVPNMKAGRGSSMPEDLYLYPDSNYGHGPVNAHIPFIPPESGGATGNMLDVEKNMKFHLPPFVDLSQGGSVTFFVRDNKRRTSKMFLALQNKKYSLRVAVLPASKGRLPVLKLMDVGGKWPRELSSVGMKKAIGADWKKVTLDVSPKKALMKIGDEQVELALPHGLPAKELILGVFHVDDLVVKGKGELVLDWNSGYAARIKPQADCKAIQTRLFGFDTMMITTDPEKRECPRIQVINGTDKPQAITYKFDLKSENNKIKESWTQTIEVKPHLSAMRLIKFPMEFKTDIYHLDVTSENKAAPFKADKHFMYVERRDEPAGPNKFALHHFHCSVLGDWTETLPIGKAIRYNCWGYIVGPAWVRDWNGEHGLDPNTPTDEWWWQRDTDIALKAGIETSVCIISQPLLDWQREKVYTEKGMMGKLAWGLRGGKTNAKKYRKFVRAFAERYKGRVKEYEVENEPNAPHGLRAEDYPPVVQAVYEEVKAVDPDAKVYGICGTANFLGYMKEVFDKGGAKYMDGVSWHTYTSPGLPDDMGLYSFLQQANKIIDATGKPMLRRNTETGIYTARRFKVDEPISPKKVQELIDKGVEPFAAKRGWHRHVLNEWDAASSLITNVTYNFLAGAKDYAFFGWATAPHRLSQMSSADIFSGTLDKKKQTPNLQALAAGVMTAQYEGMLPGTGKLVDELGVRGGLFKKENGGEMAVLWLKKGKKNVFVQCDDPEMEVFSAFGQPVKTTSIESRGKRYYQLTVSKLPVYVQSKEPGLRLIAPIADVKATQIANLTVPGQLPRKQFKISFKMINFYDKEWSDTLTFKGFSGCKMKKDTIAFSLKPGETKEVENTLILPAKSKKTRFVWRLTGKGPAGKKMSLFEGVNVKPSLIGQRVADSMTFKEMMKLNLPAKKINRNEQCHIGRPPKMSSLQEERYWKGPEELSGKVNIGYNNNGLMILIQVKDKNAILPKSEFSINGSCLELFLDFRKQNEGLGNPGYEQGVYQYLIRPAIAAGQKTAMKNCSRATSPDLKGVTVDGGPNGKDQYWVGVKIPWSAIGFKAIPKTYTFGFDLAIDGPFEGKAKRKTQMVMFGTAANYQVANKFGECVIDNNQ